MTKHMQGIIWCSVLCAAILVGTMAFGAPKGVIFVMADDMGYGDIDTLYPSPDIETPNLDNLCNQSVRLTDFHVGSTCSPTRGSLMTGRHLNAGGVWHTILVRDRLRADEQTLAEVFQANDWETGIFGKWHLGEGYPFAPRYRGFDVELIHGGGGIGQTHDYYGNDYYSGVDFSGNPTTADVYWLNGEQVTADEFCTDYWFTHAKKFIGDCITNETPFFCYVAPNACHEPLNAPHGYKEGFDGLLENIDDNMLWLDQYLDELGVKEDVLLVFTTDNGTISGRTGGLRGGKGKWTDGGHNVPCFWRWKNGSIGGDDISSRDMPSLSAVADVFPTFMELCELERPEGGYPLHGISLKDQLTNPQHEITERIWVVDRQRATDLVFWKQAAVMKDEVENGVITHRWRLLRDSVTADFELYDLLTDRRQSNNLNADGSYDDSALVAEMVDYYENEYWPAIVPNWEPYSPSVLGVMEEDVLTGHDWIGSAVWSSALLQNAKPGSGEHVVQFSASGRYRIELRRWPREDGSALGDSDANGIGVQIDDIQQARVEINRVGAWTVPVTGAGVAAVIEADVPADLQTTLKASFQNSTGADVGGAYYVYIQKLYEQANLTRTIFSIDAQVDVEYVEPVPVFSPDVLEFVLESGGPDWLSLSSEGMLSGTPELTDLGLNRWNILGISPAGVTNEFSLSLTVGEEGSGEPSTGEVIQFGGRYVTSNAEVDRLVWWDNAYMKLDGSKAKDSSLSNSASDGFVDGQAGDTIEDRDAAVGSGLIMTLVNSSGASAVAGNQNIYMDGVAGGWAADDYVTVSFNKPVRLIDINTPLLNGGGVLVDVDGTSVGAVDPASDWLVFSSDVTIAAGDKLTCRAESSVSGTFFFRSMTVELVDAGGMDQRVITPVLSGSVIDDAFEVRWPGVENESYTVLSTTNLTSGSWETNAMALSGVRPFTKLHVESKDSVSFFQVEIQR